MAFGALNLHATILLIKLAKEPKYNMSMHNVAILGSNGLLGYALTKFFLEEKYSVIEFNRGATTHFPQSRGEKIELSEFNPDQFLSSLQGVKTVINCIGMIKHRIKNDLQDSVSEATLVNSNFPKVIDELATKNGFQVIQIGTDCVYSGSVGKYNEYSLKDATDSYGLSKIMGESNLLSTLLLRSSFIGREEKTRVEFLEWILEHPQSAVVTGYTNHLWNGLTVLQIARIISGVISKKNFMLGVQHLVPNDYLSKFELAKLVSVKFGRDDLTIEPIEAPVAINRTLSTARQAENVRLWLDAGYPSIPTIEEMINEYAKWLGNA